MSALTHYQMTLDEHRQQRGSYVDPDRYKPGHRDYRPEMLCHTGDGHAQGTRNRPAVTCPACRSLLAKRCPECDGPLSVIPSGFLECSCCGNLLSA